ncbi:cytidine deaminase [Chitinophaga costaii]|uniref:Cytidine deaminase n=1 Tax=Chitinophaga costaii TaxID=1335309 RepID=A0A1C4FVT3_9BACT|nr:cytidine deaminase [Chitinophaga costaii]PUZ27261.1 cytidine deaminase [Chitinophaga costaii]SCC60038.1 cytidine deaminase [Chitinophaga costaii]
MHLHQQYFEYQVYDDVSELAPADAHLLQRARAITQHAYAPYSHFRVGAAALLANGQVVTGTNQENASYPVGICAERTTLSAVSSLFPNMAIQTLAVSYFNEQGLSNRPISPCGICRQSLSEYENRTATPIRLLLSGQTGKIFVIEKASQLLPFSFSNEDML